MPVSISVLFYLSACLKGACLMIFHGFPIDEEYFEVIYIDDPRRYDLISSYTGHCRSIQMPDSYDGKLFLMHRHHATDPLYHAQKRGGSVKAAVKAILSHDSYVLSHQK